MVAVLLWVLFRVATVRPLLTLSAVVRVRPLPAKWVSVLKWSATWTVLSVALPPSTLPTVAPLPVSAWVSDPYGFVGQQCPLRRPRAVGARYIKSMGPCNL